MVTDTRLYGTAIAFASGGYSVWSATTASRMGTGGLLMAALGIVVVLHGVVLVSGFADRMSTLSGPLMIVYSVLMLLNQAVLGSGMMGGGSSAMDGGMGMDGGTEMGGSAMSAGMGWDAGMVTLALLMLVSGLIMTRGETMGGTNGM
ncbi:hypothetical protein [Halomicrobium sp. LC1Hm]|uniref:hypothetical protein n=1 Tax=Halomicrobium sp. LC1Hm TaxID=2610902 RepID=UPI00129842C9|nr:hypothetical protein [Halomicrobium sp. LC1Hm]QGA84071.1 putative membrane protein [Halomicrobium sp. LC1Hm]